MPIRVGAAAGYAAAFGVGYAAMFAAAGATRPWLLVVAAAFVVAVELMMRLRSVATAGLFARSGAGLPTRAGLGQLAVVLLAAHAVPRSAAVGTAVTGAVVVVLAAAVAGLRGVVEQLRRPPLLTRNLALDGPPLPPAPGLVAQPPGLGVIAGLLAAIGLAIDCHSGGTTAVAVTLSIATAGAGLPVVALGLHAGSLVRSGARARLTEAAVRAVEQLAPEVVVYFASTEGEVYQVNQWLGPVERLDRPALVMVRSYEVLAAVAQTSLPVICAPYNGTIAALPLPDRVVTLFPTHSGNNLSMIRRPQTRTVFVGHGDSDKPDSVNPFARVYDEIWVAGPLGRRRYAESPVDIPDAAIIEVGRPQVVASTSPPPEPPVVVYAPTWEGWGDDAHHSSLAQIGPALVAALNARPGIRVRYRPHPLTGHRSPQLRAADAQIAAILGRVPEAESLAETLAGASAVVADVSSVVGEYLPYDRPYALVDTRGLGAVAFTAQFPSTRAGFVIGSDLGGLDAFLAAAMGGVDPTATLRHDLLLDVLGDPSTSQQRFAAAVDRLLTR